MMKPLELLLWKRLFATSCLLAGLLMNSTLQAAEPNAAALERAYRPEIQPLVRQYCADCHAGDRTEAEIDLAAFATFAEIRQHPEVWQKVGEMLESGQMPPKEAKQPSEAERTLLRDWVRSYLSLEAQSRAGDPGRVVLRRLSNAEYTYTLRDLTGVAALDPAREFPVDGAAGEGFTNTGNALVMSPALVTKYLDAAKAVAAHAVLLPDGFRFSPHVTRADQTQDTLAQIRDFYSRYTDRAGGDQVNLQGVVFHTNEGGRLPLEKYLAATLEERPALSGGGAAVAAVARQRGLSEKYLALLWETLSRENPKPSSLLLDGLRSRWRTAKPADAPALAAEVARWQQALWRFTSVGHIGKLNGPTAWMEPLLPLTPRHEIALDLPTPASGQEVVVYLAAGDAGDGNEHDFVVWERPRIIAPGRPDILLRDVRPITHELAIRRERIIGGAGKCLEAAAEANASPGQVNVSELAQKQGIEPETLAAWLQYLGIATAGPANLGTPLTRKIESASGYDFVRGWVGDDALSVVANSSDQHVRIPGNMKPHGVAVHPAPGLAVAVAWRSPVATTLQLEGAVQHAHPECGNGVTWALELRRGNSRQRLAAGNSQGATPVPIGPLEKVAVQPGDCIALVIGPRDGNHSCDLTAIDLTLSDGSRRWSLAGDLSPEILAGNPHDDSFGNKEVWHLFSEPAGGASGHVIPAGSVLAKWQVATSAGDRRKLAADLQRLLQAGPATLPKDSPDAALVEQLTSLGGPLLTSVAQSIAADPTRAAATGDSPFGLDPAVFGKHPGGDPIDRASLCVQAPAVLEVRLPADLVAGAKLAVSGVLHAGTGREGSVQVQVLTEKPPASPGLMPTAVSATNAQGPWTANNRGVAYAAPVVVNAGSGARQRFESMFAEFRDLFPAALCYTKIVPVDEVVTLTLYYREDDHLRRLMLSEAETAELEKLWAELHFISQDALTLVDAFAQLMEYATQDADPKVFEPLRKPINDRAAAYRQQLVDSEPRHVEALLAFAARAYRRPLSEAELSELSGLYQSLRAETIPHDEAFRLTLARVLVAPSFLYRIEKPVPGDGQGPVSDWELASRLSYFLWSSQPDDELRQLAAAGKLRDPATLRAQARRMLRDGRSRRLATEFACQWLHIQGFDELDEKSERHFPTFVGVRDDMYEESIRFFADMFQNDGSVLDILDADHTFLNEELAKHYGIPGVAGSEWRRVDGVKKYARGGILTLGTTLSKQSGASRTSPILRGNWLSEVVLGEKLPRPPKDVPVLADAIPAGLTERQLTERHSSDAACAKCHVRIDPFGFSLENYDAIGRFREQDAGGLAIDARTTLPDGTKLDGIASLRNYLLTARRDAFLRQFNRKLLGFALGRAVQLSDESLLAEMEAKLAGGNFRFGTAVEAIVLSRQFREIRGLDSAYND